ncbi:site-specific integrase [Streptomyces sp. ASQP_92]|uniref:tyrosine-type recombinase/integrase n=1 Tax=Streptomyces sp. ASQP_92 TaxID=2979116 RepID=UPI0021C1E216|nr:site-specific integrase [Streptomyces sp. ASQP_92]MCT9092938.1 site-specific integrase [Streptomyces sp. ASQP_92]
MPAKARNNPRQIRVQSCGCKLCTDRFRPGEPFTRKDCTGPWQSRYRDPSGRQRAKTFAGKNAKAKAEAFLDKTRDQVRTGSFVDLDRGQVTLTEWRKQWQESLTLAENTAETTASVWLNHVQPHFGSWPLVSIGHLDVEIWIAKLSRVVGRGTIEKAYQMLDQMLRVALRDRRIAHNPCEGVKLPPAPPKHPDDLLPPTYDQLAAIRANMPEHYHPMLIFAEETGLRWGELVGLRLCHVDFKRSLVQVRETVIQVRGKVQRKAYPKTDAGCRSVPLSARAARALKGHLAAHPASIGRSAVESGMHPEELVFRSPRAGSKTRVRTFSGVLGRSNFWRLWTKAAEDAGVARKVINPKTKRAEMWPHEHDIRHAFTSRLHANGVPEADAQKILGHKRGGKVTWLYTHAREDAVARVREALDADASKLVS